MNKTYFSLDEDFEKIIKNTLNDKEVTSINQITTGWTNIVFEVTTTEGNYFFRFPRDDFWIKVIVKDYQFAKFIYGKTDFETVGLMLFYDNDRPFSVHKKIEGCSLASKMNELTQEQVKVVSNDIAKFMYQMHNIKFDKNEIFDINNISLNLIDFLDELLNVHVHPEDKEFWKSSSDTYTNILDLLMDYNILIKHEYIGIKILFYDFFVVSAEVFYVDYVF